MVHFFCLILEIWVEGMKHAPGIVDAACEWVAGSVGSELLLWFGLSLIQDKIQNTHVEHTNSFKQFLWKIMVQNHQVYSPLILNKLILVIVELSKRLIPVKIWSLFWEDVLSLRQTSESLFLKFLLVMIEEFTNTKRDLNWGDKNVIKMYMIGLVDQCLEMCLLILKTSSITNLESGKLSRQDALENAEACKTLVHVDKPLEKLVLKVFSALCMYIDVSGRNFPDILEELFRISIGSDPSHSQSAQSCLIEISKKPYTPKG